MDYVNKGGMIFASGKSGYLTREMGDPSTGTYNTNQLLSSSDKNLIVKLNGCDNYTDDNSTEDFLTSVYMP